MSGASLGHVICRRQDLEAEVEPLRSRVAAIEAEIATMRDCIAALAEERRPVTMIPDLGLQELPPECIAEMRAAVEAFVSSEIGRAAIEDAIMRATAQDAEPDEPEDALASLHAQFRAKCRKAEGLS
jgi:hypothetical protein